MKKQTLFYGISLAALAASYYALSKSNKSREKYFAAIVKNTRELATLKDLQYLGGWSIEPLPDQMNVPFHFGYNFVDNNGQLRSEEYWVNDATGKILNHQVVQL